MSELGRVAVPGILAVAAAATSRRSGMSNMVRTVMRESDSFFSKSLKKFTPAPEASS